MDFEEINKIKKLIADRNSDKSCADVWTETDTIIIARKYAKAYHQSELLKLNKSDVISSVCDCRNSELEKDSLFPVYCHNCNAYVQNDL